MVLTFFFCTLIEALPCSSPEKVMSLMVAHIFVSYQNRMVVGIFVLSQDPAALGNSSENGTIQGGLSERK